jgi:malonate-semialdehyde dehydrogenase (acetylating)/methylmalonate-semialdehyde dehydrogenase
VQALGGAKNHMIVMPDAEVSEVVPHLLNASFGNAGERCMAGSVAVAVGSEPEKLLDALIAGTQKLVVGPGDKPGVDVGPLIREEHRQKVAAYIGQGAKEGAEVLVDGRTEQSRPGFFLGPTILDRVVPTMSVGHEEIFGPVLSVSRAATLDDAISIANSMALGNMAVLFTQSGRAAREFRGRVEAGMVGVNVPIAQPFAFFPFSGWKNSFFGDLHVHGTDGIDFFTRKKVFISRW